MAVKTPSASKAGVVFSNLPIDIQRALRNMQTVIDQLQATVETQGQQLAGKVGSSHNELLNVSQFVKTQLQANGQTPLSIASLPGVTAQPQKALVPSYGTVSVNVPGSVVYQNGQLYRSDGTKWIALTSGGVLFDTHAHRSTYLATGYAPGTLYFETDRSAFYVTGGSTWTYAAGVMVAVLASRPTDLGSTDQGFQFLASDTLNGYEWSGSTWVLTTNGASLTTGNLTETGSAVLTVTGGTGAVLGTGAAIQVKQASGTVNGYLSSADWTTFNSKQAALGYTPLNPANNLSEVTAATARTNLAVAGTTISNTFTSTQTFSQTVTFSLSIIAKMLSTNCRTVTAATDTATVNTDHTLVLSGVTTETLPASPVTGHEFFVINIGGSAATLSGNGHNIWVAGVSAASITLASGASVILKYDLTNLLWRQVGDTGGAAAAAQTAAQAFSSNASNLTSGTVSAALIPTLNQNTTGTAANVTGTVALGNGGTGQTTAAAALTALGGASLTGTNSFSGSNTFSSTVAFTGSTGITVGQTSSANASLISFASNSFSGSESRSAFQNVAAGTVLTVVLPDNSGGRIRIRCIQSGVALNQLYDNIFTSHNGTTTLGATPVQIGAGTEFTVAVAANTLSITNTFSNSFYSILVDSW